MTQFLNRKKELRELDLLSEEGGLYVLSGRRRLGKTSLIKHWLKNNNKPGIFLYTQAIEASATIQLEQIVKDLSSSLSIPVTPKTWEEFFAFLETIPEHITLCIDEFPYLISSDNSLLSRFQKWIDHRKKRDIFLVLSGSSTRMMHDTFLNQNSPLYDRALKVTLLQPMSFENFCNYLNLSIPQTNLFQLYSLVGGVPKYWEWLRLSSKLYNTKFNPVFSATALFFEASSWMNSEPQRILSDERVGTQSSKSLLEAIGRGSSKPGEISSRLGISQNNFPKVVQPLIDASLIQKETPFGTSERNTKKNLYQISDPALLFWYSVYSPQRTTWSLLSKTEQKHLIDTHTGIVFENYIRSKYIGARRYWERDIEIDLIAEILDEKERKLLVGEVKWRKLSEKEKIKVQEQLQKKFFSTPLCKKHQNVEFRVFDGSELNTKD